MENNYTEHMKNMALRVIEEFNEVDNIDFMIDFMQESNFMPFNKRLQKFIKELTNDENIDCVSYIKEEADKHNVDINDKNRTVKSWIEKGSTPDRDKAFLIVFSLGLDIEQTCDFFRRVYFDRPFDVKNTKEMIYFYCIKNNLSHNKAQQLYSIVKDTRLDVDNKKKTVHTMKIQDKVKDFINEEQFIDYAKRHYNDVEGEKIKAHEVFNNFKITLQNRLKDKEALEFQEYDKNGKKEGALRKTRDFMNDESADEYNDYDRESDSFLYDYILKVKASDGTATTTIFKKEIKKKFPPELFKCFTEVKTLCNIDKGKKISNEEMRKAIILFFFYNWGTQKRLDPKEFKELCNEILSDCGYPELYYGNPFDWLFLTCAEYYDYDSNARDELDIFALPIDMLRAFVSEILDDEE